MNLKGRSFLTLRDFTQAEIMYLLEKSAQLKQQKRGGIYEKHLQNKNIALIFEKPSTRTRCAFTVAAADEGAHPEYLGKNDIQLGHKESVEDTARVLGRMFDGIQYRGFSQRVVETLAKYAGVPVWNGLTDEDHPTQILADLLTIQEQFSRLKGINFVYIGDGRNNMANALLIGTAKVGMNCTICSPKELQPDKALVDLCEIYAAESGGKIIISEDIRLVESADVVYTDVWCSMGEEEKAAERLGLLKDYQVNKKLLMLTGNKETIFMHCLPAVKGNEVTEEIFEQHANTIFQQAENRMHTIKAVMVSSIYGEF